MLSIKTLCCISTQTLLTIYYFKGLIYQAGDYQMQCDTMKCFKPPDLVTLTDKELMLEPVP